MKVMLVAPVADPKFGVLWPPLGLGFLATSLRKDGHDVVIVDCFRECPTPEQFQEVVRKANPDVVGFTVFTIAVRTVKLLILAVRMVNSRAMIVVGGPHVSALPEQVFKDLPGINYAIRGEGEIPLRSLLSLAEPTVPLLATVPGLIYRDGGNTKANESIFAANLDEYGQPAWDLLDLKAYYQQRDMPAPVICSRGCPFPCTFCAAKVTSGQRLRMRSMDSIFQELHMLQENYGVNHFVIYDEGFGSSKAFMLKFCERIKQDGFKAAFDIGPGMRLDQIDEELLNTLANSGFRKYVALGIESGSERVLKLMKKKSDPKLIHDKVTLMARMGWRPGAFIILGFPGETEEEMEQTIQMSLDLPFDSASFTAFMPLPGTEATRNLIASGELPADFDYSSIRATAITYAPQGISPKRLQNIRRMALLRFYMRPKILFPMLRSWSWTMLWFWIKRVATVFFTDRTK